MPLSDNAFIGLDSATLVTLQTAYTQAVLEIATAGQSNSVPGRSFTQADLSNVKRTLQEVSQAIRVAVGTARRSGVARTRDAHR